MLLIEAVPQLGKVYLRLLDSFIGPGDQDLLELTGSGVRREAAENRHASCLVNELPCLKNLEPSFSQLGHVSVLYDRLHVQARYAPSPPQNW